MLTARDVTAELAAQAREQELAAHAAALEAAPEPCGIVDDEGRFRYANRRIARVAGHRPRADRHADAARRSRPTADGSTVRSIVAAVAGALRQEMRWRRPDGHVLDVELALAPGRRGNAGLRILTARDVSAVRRTAERNERDQSASPACSNWRSARMR